MTTASDNGFKSSNGYPPAANGNGALNVAGDREKPKPQVNGNGNGNGRVAIPSLEDGEATQAKQLSELNSKITMTEAVRALLEGVGEDPEREGLLKTPKRVAEALQFLTQGYEQSLETIVNGAIFDENHNEMVLVRDIDLFSLCEHHMLPFMGRAHVAYIPNRKVVGLSKLARIVEMYARRLQVQERLTRQVAEAIQTVLEPQGVAVVVEASHMCMVMRGVQKPGSWTVTSAMLGVFQEDPRTREEFLNLIRHQPRFH